MSERHSLPDYAQLTQVIQPFLPDTEMAYVHGMLCGYICAAPEDTSAWERVFPELVSAREAHHLINDIYQTSQQELSDFSMEFNIMQPDDDNALPTRAAALGSWCQGFLTALGYNDITPERFANTEAREGLEDLTEISQINVANIADTEEDELAYVELVEYVRLTTLMIFHELREDQASPE